MPNRAEVEVNEAVQSKSRRSTQNGNKCLKTRRKPTVEQFCVQCQSILKSQHKSTSLELTVFEL